MSEILTEAVERIDTETAEAAWQKGWSNGGSWELEWEQN